MNDTTDPQTAEPDQPLVDRMRRALAEVDGFAFEELEPHDYQRHAIAVLSVLPPAADRAAVLREEAARIRAHCPDHLDSDSATGSWMACHCAVADDMERRMADEEQQAETQAREETVHGCPPDGSGLTPCCGRTPFELPRTDRMSDDPALVTCTTPPAVVAEPGKESGPAIPCSWAATRYQHSPHDWSPQPGMDPVRCPGWSDEESTP